MAFICMHFLGGLRLETLNFDVFQFLKTQNYRLFLKFLICPKFSSPEKNYLHQNREYNVQIFLVHMVYMDCLPQHDRYVVSS